MANVMMTMMMMATVTAVALLVLWRDVRLCRRTQRITRGRTTALAQATADAAEDSTIRSYREHRVHVGSGLTVSCGQCGSSQIVRPHSGMHRFALVCSACHGKTLFSRSGSLWHPVDHRWPGTDRAVRRDEGAGWELGGGA
jgi:ribosomal protein S27E